MIAQIRGRLESVEHGYALLEVGAMTYELWVPTFTAARLGGELGKDMIFHTFHYVESQNQGSMLIPRLAGFTNTFDRDFFELFTTCKGIGYRKALRAMALETSQIATAIADRNVSLLQTLPEIGKRTAETIIASLNGKVDAFVGARASEPAATGGPQKGKAAAGGATSMVHEVTAILLQLGENRVQISTWIDAAMRKDDKPKSTQDLLSKVYQVRDSLAGR